MSAPGRGDDAWPSLPLEAWKDTSATLHMWMQVVGKIRLVQTPWLNHSWHVARRPEPGHDPAFMEDDPRPRFTRRELLSLAAPAVGAAAVLAASTEARADQPHMEAAVDALKSARGRLDGRHPRQGRPPRQCPAPGQAGDRRSRARHRVRAAALIAGPPLVEETAGGGWDRTFFRWAKFRTRVCLSPRTSSLRTLATMATPMTTRLSARLSVSCFLAR
jgi:Family of unknown function (DUF5996)